MADEPCCHTIWTARVGIILEMLRIVYPAHPTAGEIGEYWARFYDIPKNWEDALKEAVDMGLIVGAASEYGDLQYCLTGRGREIFRSCNDNAARIEAMCGDHIDELFRRSRANAEAEAAEAHRRLRASILHPERPNG